MNIVFLSIKVYCLDPPVVQHSTHNGSPESVTFTLETVLKLRNRFACLIPIEPKPNMRTFFFNFLNIFI